jgi:hypothetical protein
MNNPTIELTQRQVLNALSQFPPKTLKKIIDNLFRKKLYVPPTLAEITRKASSTVKKQKITPATIDEAIQWARSQK